MLGGAHRQRGVTEHAERNVWCDPEAAVDVLGAPFRDVLLVTMDATCSAPLDGADAARLRALATPSARAAADFRRRPDRLVPARPCLGGPRGSAAPRPARRGGPRRSGPADDGARVRGGRAHRSPPVRRHPVPRRAGRAPRAGPRWRSGPTTTAISTCSAPPSVLKSSKLMMLISRHGGHLAATTLGPRTPHRRPRGRRHDAGARHAAVGAGRRTGHPEAAPGGVVHRPRHQCRDPLGLRRPAPLRDAAVAAVRAQPHPYAADRRGVVPAAGLR